MGEALKPTGEGNNEERWENFWIQHQVQPDLEARYRLTAREENDRVKTDQGETLIDQQEVNKNQNTNIISFSVISRNEEHKYYVIDQEGVSLREIIKDIQPEICSFKWNEK